MLIHYDWVRKEWGYGLDEVGYYGKLWDKAGAC